MNNKPQKLCSLSYRTKHLNKMASNILSTQKKKRGVCELFKQNEQPQFVYICVGILVSRLETKRRRILTEKIIRNNITQE